MNGLIFRDVFRVVSCCSSTCCTTCTCMLERESIVESTPSRDLNVATNSSLKCMIVPGVYLVFSSNNFEIAAFQVRHINDRRMAIQQHAYR